MSLRIATAALSLALALSGCASLLPVPQTPPRGAHGAIAPAAAGQAPWSLDADPDLANERRAVIRAKLDALRSAPRGECDRADDVALLVDVFAALALQRPAAEALRDVEATLDAARERIGTPRTGYLLFFEDHPRVPRVAVVLDASRAGGLEALACTRGAYRVIRVSPEAPRVRRRGASITNSFLRARSPDDPPRAPGLAGELLVGIGTLLD